MATVRLHTATNFFDKTVTSYGSVTDATGSLFQRTDASGNRSDLFGAFYYDPLGYLIGGDTTGFDVFQSGALVSQVAGIDLPVLDVAAAFNSGSWHNIFDLALAGDDTVLGSEMDDRIRGFAGDDDLKGKHGGDNLYGDGGNDTLEGGLGNDWLAGGDGEDTAIFDVAFADVTVNEAYGGFSIASSLGTDHVSGVEIFQFSDRTLTAAELIPAPPEEPEAPGAGGGAAGGSGGGALHEGTVGHDRLLGTAGNDTLHGGEGNDTLDGLDGNDHLVGAAGNDTIRGGDGSDTLNGGDGNDMLTGGASEADLRDVIFAGAGDDRVDGGFGNDLIYGQGGDDTIAGGFGADELHGQDGDDVITGSAFADVLTGGAGADFLNGGFGHDLINGGSGADRFYHAGGSEEQILGHGSDWVQDYSAAEGDVLVFGDALASADQFQVNLSHTEHRDSGERAGQDSVQEAFVIYKPTGQVLWALVDGAGQDSINLQIGAETFDLLG